MSSNRKNNNPRKKKQASSSRPKYVYPEGNRWRAAVKLPDRIIWKRFASEDAAIRWQAWAQPRAERGESIDKWVDLQSAEKPRFFAAMAAFERHFLDQRRNLQSTEVQNYQRRIAALCEHFGDVSLDSFNILVIGKYATYLADTKHLSTKTAYRYLNVLKEAFKIFLAMGWVETDPASPIKAVKPTGKTREMGKRRRIEPNQYIRVADRLSADYRPPYWVQAFGGLRVGEVFGLKVGDYNIGGGYLELRRQRGAGYGETSGPENVKETLKRSGLAGVLTTRFVPVPDSLRDLLLTHLEESGKIDKPDEFMFDLPTNSSYSAYTLAVGDALQAEGVVSTTGKRLSSHTLRYSYSNIIKDAKPSDGVRSRVLGHVDAHNARVTEEVYTDKELTKADLDEVREIMNRFIARELGGDLGQLVDPGPGSEWLPVLQAGELAGYQSDHGLKLFAQKNNVRLLHYKFAGNNVANLFVHHEDLVAALSRRDRAPRPRDLAAQLNLTLPQFLRAVDEVGLTTDAPRETLLQLVHAHLEAGQVFRRAHVSRATAADMLRVNSSKLSAYIAAGWLCPVVATGFQFGVQRTWLDRNSVRQLAKRLLPPNSTPLDPSRYAGVLEACRLLGIARPTLFRWVKAGVIDTITDGGRTYITRVSIDAALTRGSKKLPPAA